MTFVLPGRILTGKISLVDTSTVISSSVSINLRFPGELRTCLTKKIKKVLVSRGFCSQLCNTSCLKLYQLEHIFSRDNWGVAVLLKILLEAAFQQDILS